MTDPSPPSPIGPPPGERESVRSFVWEWRLAAPPERLWPLVSDTDRLNRMAGLPAVRFRFEPRPSGGSERFAEIRLLGVFPIRYRELPFEWVENRRYSARREFPGGPLRWYAVTAELFPDGAGSRLVQTATFSLRWRLLAPLLRLAARRAKKALDKLYARVEREAARPGGPPPPGQGAPSTEEKALALLDRAEPPVDRRLLALLARHIATAEESELRFIRPFALARRLDWPRREVLAACLSAVKAGALDLTWNLICPHCRGAKKQASSLAEVTSEAYCDACNIRYEVQFDRSLEATFSPAPALRRVPEEIYCIGGPQNTPHVVQQTIVPGGAARAEQLLLAPGAYRVRCTKSPLYAGLRAEPDARRAEGGAFEVAVSAEGLAPASIAVPAGRVEARYRNQTAEEALFILERTAWADDAATALDVAFFDHFRRLFGPDALRPGERIAVNNVALLFTDLKDSTAMYESIGDAVAYGRVRDHFEILEEAIRAVGGGLVKTIGDAVMASFRSAEDAVRAAFAMHEGIARFNARSGREPLVLKMGLHAGHAIAVNLNDRLDFFGRMVNIAARAQEASRGGDVILTQAVFEQATVARLLAETPHRTEALTLRLRGVAGEFPVRRVWPSPG